MAFKDSESPILQAPEHIKWSILKEATTDELVTEKRQMLLAPLTYQSSVQAAGDKDNSEANGPPSTNQDTTILSQDQPGPNDTSDSMKLKKITILSGNHGKKG